MSDSSPADSTPQHHADPVENDHFIAKGQDAAWSSTRDAVIQWGGGDTAADTHSASGASLYVNCQSSWLGDCNPNPTTCSISFNPVSKTLLFKLRIVVEIQKPRLGKTNLFFYIPANNIQSLTLAEPGYANNKIAERPSLQHRLGTDPFCLLVELKTPAQLVAPAWPLTPSNKASDGVLTAVAELALQKTFTIWLQACQEPIPTDPFTLAAKDRLELICKRVNASDLKAKSLESQIKGLYQGRGGCMVSEEALRLSAQDREPHLPSYSEGVQEAQPTPAGKDVEAHVSKKRRLSDADDSASAAATLTNVFRRMLSEQLGQFETRMQKWVDDRLDMQDVKFEKQFVNLEQKLDQISSRLDERVTNDERLAAQDKKCQERFEHLEDELENLSSQIDDRVWVEVDDLKTSIREDFDDLRTETEDFVRQEVRSAANGVARYISDIEINVIGGRLDFVPPDE